MCNKKLKFKIIKWLEYFNFILILRMNGIILFHQNLLFENEKNLNLTELFVDKNYIWKFMKKRIMKNISNKKFYNIIKNFRNILIIKNILDIKNMEKILLEKKNLILGYLINNIFFFKKDWNMQKIEKKLLFNKFIINKKINYIIKNNLLWKLKYIFLKYIYITLIKKIIKNGDI